MKYQLLLRFLRSLIYVKRFFWWIGAKVYLVISKIIGRIWRKYVFFRYKISYAFKKAGINGVQGWVLKRGFLQLFTFVILLLIALPHSKLLAKNSVGLPGQKTLAFALSGPGEIDNYEEVFADNFRLQTGSTWRDGAFNNLSAGSLQNLGNGPGEVVGVNAGGLAFSKPILIPGAPLVRTRNQAEDYVVQAGDSLGGIASDFGVRVETIIWENNLSVKSYLKPGQIIKIPPVDGVMHVVKKGDTLQKIAGLYKAKPEDIASFNALQADGRDLKVGVKIMVPGGTAVATVAAAKKPTSVTKPSLVSRVAVPPPSVESAGATGFIWPSGARNITQYFGFSHHALDIAGPMHTPNYAAQDGIVEVANCPPPGEYRGPKLNHGYGCYVIINHGAGIKTLYGHNDLVLVSEGDQVERGQTVGLMGNTGNVRGRTGIHLHFEVRKNGTTVNPLGYVR